MQNQTLKLRPLVFSLLSSQITWAVIMYLVRNDLDIYVAYPRPWYAPSLFIIILMFGIIFLFLGLSAYLVISSKVSDISSSMYYYLSSFVLIFIWSVMFFKFSMLRLGMLIIILLILALLATVLLFYTIEPLAGIFVAPALVWIIYLAVVNGKILFLLKQMM